MIAALKARLADPAPSADLPPTAAEIAASIRRPAALVDGEARLTELRQRRNSLRDVHTKRCQAGKVDNRAMNAAEAEIRMAESAIVAERRAIGPMRQAHAAKVRAALAPMHDAAARRVRDALRVLDEAVATMDAVRAEVTRRGGDMPMAGRIEADLLREQVARWSER